MENSEIINKAIEYVKRCYGSPDISVGKVAENAGFSLDYFSRIFLAHTGFTVSGYINYQRLKKAAIRLRMTDDSILETALNVGFESHEGFIKAFKKRYGMTPSEYRNKNKSTTLNLADVSDSSVVSRFLYENPDLKPLPDSVWDDLLERDFKLYAYLFECAAAQGVSLAEYCDGENKALLYLFDDLSGTLPVNIISDNSDMAVKLINRFIANFPNTALTSTLSPDEMKGAFEGAGLIPTHVRVISHYCGEKPKCDLPDGIAVKRLCQADIPKIEKVEDRLPRGYARHLMSPHDYADSNVLEYGVFKKGEIIMIAGCGLSDRSGTAINDSISYYLTAEKPDNNVFRQVFAAIVADVIDLGAVPYDDNQYGKYAENHGGFTALDMGFEPVGYVYRLSAQREMNTEMHK